MKTQPLRSKCENLGRLRRGFVEEFKLGAYLALPAAPARVWREYFMPSGGLIVAAGVLRPQPVLVLYFAFTCNNETPL